MTKEKIEKIENMEEEIEEIEEKEGNFYLVAWKEYRKRKIINRGEIIKENNEKIALMNMMAFNANRNTSTVDYMVFPIEEILEKAGLELKELVVTE